MQPLLGPGFVTAQQVDQARTAQRTAQIALKQAQLQADEARQVITNTKPTEAGQQRRASALWRNCRGRANPSLNRQIPC